MEREAVFNCVQRLVIDVPLILIGSGSSAPYGLPSMYELGQGLLTALNTRYEENPSWALFRSNIQEGQDLETALEKIALPPELLDDIRKETWHIVSKKDIELYYRVLFGNEKISLARLIKKFYQAHPQCVNILTTNYDRVIEYACDSVQIPLNTGFSGVYSKYYTGEFSRKNAVNLVKVHGSLDVFKDAHDVAVSVPLQNCIPVGLKSEIVTPGISKFQAVLRGTSRQLLNESDRLIGQATSYLCIGYGFNDEQIQENIIASIRIGKPMVVVTKTISEHAAHLLANNATNFVSIQCGKEPNTTEFCINRDIIVLEGNFWSVNGFMQIID